MDAEDDVCSEDWLALADEDGLALADEDWLALADEGWLALADEDWLALADVDWLALADEDWLALVDEDWLALVDEDWLDLADVERLAFVDADWLAAACAGAGSVRAKDNISAAVIIICVKTVFSFVLLLIFIFTSLFSCVQIPAGLIALFTFYHKYNFFTTLTDELIDS